MCNGGNAVSLATLDRGPRVVAQIVGNLVSNTILDDLGTKVLSLA
jgi:hypothetical protein